MSKPIQFCCAVLLLCCPMSALADTPDAGKHKPPQVTLNENDTPLDKMIEKAKNDIAEKVAARKLEEAKEGKTDCADTESLPEDDDKPGKKAKACRVMQFKVGGGKEKIKDPVEVLEDARHNKVGKRVKTRTKLIFDNPNQRGVNRWDDLNELKYTGRPNLEFAGLPADPQADDMRIHKQAANVRIRTAKLPASEGINNDKDCIDSASGERHGGYVLDEQGNKTWNPDSCFDEAGALKRNLTLVEGGNGTCSHANGKVYSAQDCTDLNFTTLEELIDEDGPKQPGEPPVDGDLDGNVDDVPELGTANSPCLQHGGVPGSTDESCDFTQAVRKKLNQDALDQLPQGKKKKLFKINDATGECDPSADGEYECGQEPREIELVETMELSCPPGGIYVDDRCLVPPKGPEGEAALARVSSMEGSRTAADYAMMGFTFAPPVLKWGIFEVDRVCIFGFCFEIFALKFGYEFELAAGLRLPVKVTVTDIPSPQVVVEQERTMTAGLEAMDFKVSDYIAFCEKHDLDRSWWISDCNRFAFPEYFESLLPDWMFSSPGDRQGSEFVLQNTTFAGLVIRVFSIPLVNFAIDSSVNVPAMCTLYKMKQQIPDGVAGWIQLAADFGTNLQKSKDFMASLEGTLANCASFTTPWGYDENNEPRQFPFLTGSFTIPADCTKEMIENTAVKVGGESKPMCTGLKVSIYGATLGLGIELVPQAFSDLIKAKATTAGDAEALDQGLRFHWGEANPTIGPVRFDNWDVITPPPTGDKAFINLDDFVYYLNNFGVQVNGLIELGGLLAFIGNVATVPLVNLRFDTDDYGIPIPQHPGTGPISLEVPVTNYALTIDVQPDVLPIKPGKPGVYEVRVKNEGTVPDTMDNFTYALTNRPQSSPPFGFGIYPNVDFDCVDASSQSYWGYPFDGIADNCYNADGTLRADRTEVTVDDSVDVWAATFGATSVADVPAHSWATTPVALTVSPYKHPLTKPGDYPVRVTADSRGARDLTLAAVDPSKLPRLGAEKVVTMRIESFFDPQLTLTPVDVSVKPRGSVTYSVEAANYGNDLDQFAVQAAFAESDAKNCSLTENGRSSDCPYRAAITRIDPVNWTTVAQLHPFFPAAGSLDPLGSVQETFSILAQPEWAGMQDTTYDFTFTATSTHDTEAKNQKTARFKILATKESMSRYVNLEVTEFMGQIKYAAAQGVPMRGIEPVTLHPVSMMTAKALEQILVGDLGNASKTLASAIKVMTAVDRMVNSAGLPDLLAGDWKARSAAILADMTAAQASMVSSQ